jgi:hypothetical protein
MSRIMKRMVSIAGVAGAAFGLVVGGVAVPAFAATSPYFLVVGTEMYPAPSATNGGHGCSTGLYSTQVTAGAPAYVSAIGSNVFAGKPCVIELERSANKGKTWKVIAPKLTVPAAAVITDAKTANYYDGPGNEARACIVGPKSVLHCGHAIALAKGKGTPAGGAEPVSYSKATVVDHATTGYCGTALYTFTPVKKASSKAGADVVGLFLKTTCSMYLQESRNGGKTWTTVSATYTLPAKAAETGGYTLITFPDGPGRLARSCVRAGTSKTAFCTTAW